MEISPSPEPVIQPRRWPRFDPRAMLGLGLCGLAWGVAIAPQRQPLEGTLQLSGLSFVLQPPPGETGGPAQGFLAVPLRGLTIKGLAEGAPLVVPFSGQRLALNGGSGLSLTASTADPLEVRIALPPGTRVQSLQPEGKDQLVVDLLPPSRGGQPVPAELTIIPPAGVTTANSTAMGAVFQVPGRPEQRISPPDSQFSLPLTGATRLRLQRVNPNRAVVFESNLPVAEVKFTTER